MSKATMPVPQGLHTIQTLECGCKLKKYHSGVNVIDPEDRDRECKQHNDFKEFQCRVCGLLFPGKLSLKNHKWTHAI